MSPPSGREALDAHLASHYPGLEPWSFWRNDSSRKRTSSVHTVLVLGASEPEHWVYLSVSHRFAERSLSGRPSPPNAGSELTLRLPRRPGEFMPPPWPMNVLSWLSDFALDAGSHLTPGQVVALSGLPMKLLGTALTSVLLAVDPILGELEAANGHTRFLQVVGITEDEQEAIHWWGPDSFLQLLTEGEPLRLWLPERRSILEDPRMARRMREDLERDGSSIIMEFMPGLHLRCSDGEQPTLELRIDAREAFVFARALRTRTRHHRPFLVRTREVSLQLLPALEGERGEFLADEGQGRQPCLIIPPQRIDDLLQSFEGPSGTYSWPWFPGLVVHRL
jgi:suppressor of fused-like protein